MSLFERPQAGERTILVHVDFGAIDAPDLAELRELALSAGATIVDEVTTTRQAPTPKYFIGSGKLEELQAMVQAHEAELVVFNHELSPAQERNIEKFLSCRVLSRTGLILDIFAQRAQTFEGKLQVELAQLNYMSTRLVRGWTHLERQKGGIGLRGPGETQLETDRRLLRGRIKMIQQRLEKVRKHRSLSRQARKKSSTPSISLVGYTNAGKSTLFNALTNADIYVANQLFATLDPTLRQWQIPHFGQVVLADTVGFIRDLPHGLVEAFRATLEETLEADLLLHMVDANDPQHDIYIEQVNKVLFEEVGIKNTPIILVYNKVDAIANSKPRIDWGEDKKPERVWISAAKGTGIDLLEEAVTAILSEQQFHGTLTLSPADGKLRAALYRLNAIVKEDNQADGAVVLTLQCPRQDLERLCREHGVRLPH